MGLSFSNDPTAVGFYAPHRFEADIHDCEVEGDIPDDLNGSFYRACVDRQYPKRFVGDNILNADGAMDLFRFSNGHVDFKSRYVRTERFKQERRARKALYGMYRNPLTSDPSVRNLSHNTANTQPIYHGGKLLMLKESDPPTVIDPDTLETRGEWDFYGALKSKPFTAHPKIDPVTGEMIAFGYEAKGELTDDIAIYWINKEGRITREVWVNAPYISEMHDMAVSEDHILIPTTGLVTSQKQLEEGKLHWMFDPDIPVYVGILPRDGEAKDMRWIEVPPKHMMIHSINAVSDGNKVHMDAPIARQGFVGAFPSLDGSMGEPEDAFNNIRRWTFDLNKSDDEAFSEEILFDVKGSSLSRMDDRYTTRPFRYSFLNVTDISKPFDEERGGLLAMPVQNSFTRFDHATGKMTSYFAGSTHALSEPHFVPRRKDSPEAEGYIVGIVDNFAERRSELVILDAERLDEGEIARVIMPFRLHSQVHGWWVSAEVLRS